MKTPHMQLSSHAWTPWGWGQARQRCATKQSPPVLEKSRARKRRAGHKGKEKESLYPKPQIKIRDVLTGKASCPVVVEKQQNTSRV